MNNSPFNLVKPARRGRRLVNLLVDSFLISILNSIVISIFDLNSIFEMDGTSLTMTRAGSVIFISVLFQLGIHFVYYLFFEHRMGKTPGKMLTNTIVVTRVLTTPDLQQLVRRNLIRLIPIEPFSFLFGRMGWHDEFSGTMVVDEDQLEYYRNTRAEEERNNGQSAYDNMR